MLTERYTVWLAQLAQRNGIAANLAGIVFVLGLIAITAQAWPDNLRPWARRGIIILGVSLYASLFVVGMASFVGSAGLSW